jgi:hypothetical protein
MCVLLKRILVVLPFAQAFWAYVTNSKPIGCLKSHLGGDDLSETWNVRLSSHIEKNLTWLKMYFAILVTLLIVGVVVPKRVWKFARLLLNEPGVWKTFGAVGLTSRVSRVGYPGPIYMEVLLWDGQSYLLRWVACPETQDVIEDFRALHAQINHVYDALNWVVGDVAAGHLHFPAPEGALDVEVLAHFYGGELIGEW